MKEALRLDLQESTHSPPARYKPAPAARLGDLKDRACKIRARAEDRKDTVFDSQVGGMLLRSVESGERLTIIESSVFEKKDRIHS